jgi:ABC-type lipoprotein release transport system permease subunit
MELPTIDELSRQIIRLERSIIICTGMAFATILLGMALLVYIAIRSMGLQKTIEQAFVSVLSQHSITDIEINNQ